MTCKRCGATENLTVVYRQVLSGDVMVCEDCMVPMFGVKRETENSASNNV